MFFWFVFIVFVSDVFVLFSVLIFLMPIYIYLRFQKTQLQAY